MQLNVLNNVRPARSVILYSGSLDSDLADIKTIKQAESIASKMSKPSKMPGPSYGLPSSRCKTGSKLKSVKGSVCYGCYAADDWDWAGQTKRYTNYAFKNVKTANARRFESIHDPLWVPAMIFMIRKRKPEYFRWHDTGDLQSVEHLENIAKVCRATPNTKHWLPTREYRTVLNWREQYEEPDNLCIRASAHMIGKEAPKNLGCSSMVFNHGEMPSGATECEAYKREASCGPCRACWDKSVATIGYPYH